MNKEIEKILWKRYNDNKNQLDKLEEKVNNVNFFVRPRNNYLRRLLVSFVTSVIISGFLSTVWYIGNVLFSTTTTLISVINVQMMLITSFVISLGFLGFGNIMDEMFFEKLMYDNDYNIEKKRVKEEIEKERLKQKNNIIIKLLNSSNSQKIGNSVFLKKFSLVELYAYLDMLVAKKTIEKEKKSNIIGWKNLIISGFLYTLICVFSYLPFVSLANIGFLMGGYNLEILLFFFCSFIFGCGLGGTLEFMEMKIFDKVIDEFNWEEYFSFLYSKLNCSEEEYEKLIQKCIDEIVIKEQIKLISQIESRSIGLKDKKEFFEAKTNVRKEPKTFRSIPPKVVDCEFKGNPEEKRNAKVLRRELKR